MVGIPLGVRGVLASCVTGKEVQSGREAIAVLSAAYEALCPEAADAADAPAAADEPDSGDIAALLAGEVAELKDIRKQPFAFRTVGINSLVFIQVQYEGGPTPTELVLHACRSARDAQQNTTRLCKRLYPIERTCAAHLPEMSAAAAKLTAQHFPADAAKGCSVRAAQLRSFPARFAAWAQAPALLLLTRRAHRARSALCAVFGGV